MHLLTALSVFAYVNLDCMDGKQARRTGSSSPLGQLFDHGCDALVRFDYFKGPDCRLSIRGKMTTRMGYEGSAND